MSRHGSPCNGLSSLCARRVDPTLSLSSAHGDDARRKGRGSAEVLKVTPTERDRDGYGARSERRGGAHHGNACIGSDALTDAGTRGWRLDARLHDTYMGLFFCDRKARSFHVCEATLKRAPVVDGFYIFTLPARHTAVGPPPAARAPTATHRLSTLTGPHSRRVGWRCAPVREGACAIRSPSRSPLRFSMPPRHASVVHVCFAALCDSRLWSSQGARAPCTCAQWHIRTRISAADGLIYSHARAVVAPPLSSFMASRLVQPTTHPFGHVGSSSGGGATSPNDHWHS